MLKLIQGFIQGLLDIILLPIRLLMGITIISWKIQIKWAELNAKAELDKLKRKYNT